MSLRSPSCDGGSVLLMNLHWELAAASLLCVLGCIHMLGVEGWGQSGSHRLCHRWSW